MNLSRKLIFASLFAGLGIVAFQSCKPHDVVTAELASIAVINTVPGTNDTLDVVVDDKVIGARRLPFGITTLSQTGAASTIYLPIFSGNRTVNITKDSGRTAPVVSQTFNFTRGSIHSYFVVAPVSGQRSLVRLADNLTVPHDSAAHVRFVNTAPTVPAVDVTFVRGTIDSITITNSQYVGGAGNLDVIQAFTVARTPRVGTSVAASSVTYTIRVKTAGTGNVISTTTASLTAKRIYTFFLRGGRANVALSTANMTNYQQFP